MRWRIKYRMILFHLLFWSAYILYCAISYGWEDTDQLSFRLAPPILALTIPMTILLTYANLYALMPAYYYRQKYIAYGISVVLLLLAGGLLTRFLTYEFMVPWERLHDPVRYQMENKRFWIPVRILRISLDSSPVMVIAMLIRLMENAYDQEKRLRAIEKEKFSAEVAFLKAQVQPHFFFNTLNSLYALTLKGSGQAPGMVMRLSDLMHYMLYEAGADKVELTDEIKYLENYIGIEQMRFSDRLDLSFQYSGDIAGKMIAPLILLTFVENAFKHGIGEDAGWITIQLKVTGRQLSLIVDNSCPVYGKSGGDGLGLRNVRRRLDLTYPGKYTLDLTKGKDVFTADLKIEL